MKPTQKTSQRPIRDKEAITRSQWEFRQKTRRLPEARENVDGLSAKKTTATTKPVLSSATDDIQQTPVTPNTFSSPKVMWTRNNFRKTSFPETSLLWRGRKSIIWILYECYTWCLKRDELRALCQDLDATGTPTAAHAVWVLACPGHLWWSLQALPFDWEGNGKWLVGSTPCIGHVSRPGFLPE